MKSYSHTQRLWHITYFYRVSRPMLRFKIPLVIVLFDNFLLGMYFAWLVGSMFNPSIRPYVK